MKKRLFALVLTVAAIGVIPFSVYAGNTEKSYDKFNEVITNQEITSALNEDGTTSQVGLVTIEEQPESFETRANGCSSGNHLNVVSNGTPETTRIHGAKHPGYCQVRTTTYWRCTNCNTTGHDDTYQLVWCPSSSISGDPEEIEGPGLG